MVVTAPTQSPTKPSVETRDGPVFAAISISIPAANRTKVSKDLGRIMTPSLVCSAMSVMAGKRTLAHHRLLEAVRQPIGPAPRLSSLLL